MSDLQAIRSCCIGNPSTEKICPDNIKHLVKIPVTLISEAQTKEFLFYIQASRTGNKWELHGPTLEKIRKQIMEEGFEPEDFNFELFKCRVRNFLN
ncbi:MAG: hypothetical protein UU64_C0003G0027 [candidate division WWE3 bacterium GW2011_GWF2_41_45]|uniref:Uncharacterized protein n=3 Tax=Katanobacteria TaxID=422282 RepID=A0A1F4W269_UNCKA|nr:MAG: hypothetical protein UU55_C0003G0058 [candidate division WWE3 bacterium GW2011_GWC2_41_23]KKS10518.1 MAG: hypothetical protein UU64_C0003G0027 [candidate division WWE3 bacterium GW2011_GWF2_41_45]KKS20287.1 MAG: hypothetical protein UU79_C0002G0053 [candidate division WWE3 bacterium GW2011_GWE1_41_72]KKS27766.1 MAG: hypothetical protein UU86_C0016G0012 [candidate division WWE3 bacterium GW2011_GWC1_42_102]KKS30289.1 MAG: hypothetical protein UU90_C0003G0029 [candidate division WWE3 bact